MWIIFAFGLAVRVTLTLALGHRLLPMADQPVFLDMAEHIARGDGIMVSPELIGIPDNVTEAMRAELATRPERMRDEQLNALWGIVRPNAPTAFFEPFYPLFVGGIRWLFGPTPGTRFGPEVIPFGPNVVIVRLFQSLFDASVILILFYLGRALFTPVVGGLAGLIYSLYPYSLAFVTNLVTQNTYLFLQALMVFFFVRALDRQSWANYVLLGLTAGLTLLTRISLITFIPFIILCLWLPWGRRLKWGRLAVSMAIMVLAAVPWVMRNYALFGEPILLPTKGGRNLWEYNNQMFLPERTEDARAAGVMITYREFARRHYPDLKAKELLPFPEFTDENEIERDRILNQRVKGFILANPVVYVKLCFLRLYQLFRVAPSSAKGPLVTLGTWATVGWILPAAFLGLLFSFKHWRRRSVLYALIFYTAATAAATASGIPHRVPTDPYFILLAAFFIVKLVGLEAEPQTVPNNQRLTTND